MVNMQLSRRQGALVFVQIAISLLWLACARCAVDNYSEELLLQPLATGGLLVHMEATSAALLHDQHSHSFPPALLRMLERHGVAHVEVALTRGRRAWGPHSGPAAAAASPKPAGLELKASFLPEVADTQAAFAALTQELGGLLCAGIATAPQLAVMAAPTVGWWRGSGAPPAVAHVGSGSAASAAHGRSTRVEDAAQQAAPLRQVYAWLPQEGVCVENVAAWRRLLPCRQHAGLGALLQHGQLAAAGSVSLGLELWLDPSTGAAASSGSQAQQGTQQQQGQQQGQQRSAVRLRQVLTAVLPMPPPSQGTGHAGLLEAVFGAAPAQPCAAASRSLVYVPLPAGARPASEGPVSGCTPHHTPAGHVLACDLQQADTRLLPAILLQVAGNTSSRSGGNSTGGLPVSAPAHVDAVQVVQHVVRQGSQGGTLLVGVRVPALAIQSHAHAAMAGSAGDGSSGSSSAGSGGGDGYALLHIMQLLPWQLLVDASSLVLTLNGQAVFPGGHHLAWQAVDVRPDRTAVIELLLRLPAAEAAAGAGSESAQDGGSWYDVSVSIAFRTAFLGVFDHAPDASRGVDVPPALATLVPPSCAGNATAFSGSGASAGSAAEHGTSSDGSRSSGRVRSDLTGQLDDVAAGALPLLGGLHRDCGLRQALSNGGGGSVVPLPIPDFSMPFNVICFTSTLLAVLLGGVANTVLRTPEELAQAGGPGGGQVWKRKLRRVASLLVLMAALAVYLDRDLQRQLDATLHRWVLGRHTAPEQHGEL